MNNIYFAITAILCIIYISSVVRKLKFSFKESFFGL